MSSMKNKNSTSGGGIYCLNCFSMLIDSCTFDSLHSELGGAIYIKEAESNKIFNSNIFKYYFRNSIFTNNGANAGGALFLYN